MKLHIFAVLVLGQVVSYSVDAARIAPLSESEQMQYSANPFQNFDVPYNQNLSHSGYAEYGNGGLFEHLSGPKNVLMQEHKQELGNTQSTVSNYDVPVSYSKYPTSYQDLSFADRVNIQQAGYEPYRGKSPYAPIDLAQAAKKSETPAKTRKPSVKDVTAAPKDTPVVADTSDTVDTADGAGAPVVPGNASDSSNPPADIQIADTQPTNTQTADSPHVVPQVESVPAENVQASSVPPVSTQSENTMPNPGVAVDPIVRDTLFSLSLGEIPVHRDDGQCLAAFSQMLKNYVAAHPWGVLTADGVCQDNGITNSFIQAILDFFLSGDGCDRSVPHSFDAILMLNSTSQYYAQVSISYKSQDNVSVNVSTCIDARIEPIVM